MNPPLSPPAFKFKRPPQDGSLSLTEILLYHAKENPTHPLFRYLDTDGNLKTIDWCQSVRAFQRAAHIIKEHVGLASPEARPVVAILASADHITYFSLIAGALGAGCRVFPLSPRNSKKAILHLLQAAGCSHLLLSSDSTMQELAEDTLAVMGADLAVIPVPSFDVLFNAEESPEPAVAPTSNSFGLDEIVLLLHSSGSVAFPKVIKITQHDLMKFGLCLEYGDIDLCGAIWSAHTLPAFHFAGVIELIWAMMTGITLAVFPPVVPPVVPTAARVLDDAIATNAGFLYCIPAFLELWARDPTRVIALQKFRSVMFAGGPLQPAIGNLLRTNDINIAHMYGSTEVGGLNLILPEKPPVEGWDYFYFSRQVDPVFIPVPEIPGVHRLVVKKCATHAPAVLNTTVDGTPAFDTNDLLVRHQTNHKLWKVYGRQDDQIMHSSGEKTNPTPLEAIILKDTRIKHAVMFGRGEFNAGILVFPAEQFSPADVEGVIHFRREIWPAVQEANEFAPAHSRIFKEMILVADPSKAVELTAKGTVRREATLEIYRDEIQDIYTSVEKSSQTHLTAPESFDASSSLEFVRKVVAEVMMQTPGDDEDIFQHGCDSLQATWIRNSILHALRSSDAVEVEVGTIPDDFVYAQPTIRLLGDYLSQVVSGSLFSAADLPRRVAAMEKMVLKYTQGFPAGPPGSKSLSGPRQEAVLVTGTTGALGSYILAHLLALPEISTVYALNRRGAPLRERQQAAFVNSGIDVELLNSPKLHLLEGDLAAPDFGLDEDTLTEMSAAVTLVIHNGWQVDFNLALHSLEPCVEGTRNLVDFVLTSSRAPRFIFVSTAGVLRNCNESIGPEARVAEAKTAAGQGYAESKWVTEQMLEVVADIAGLDAVIIRPGQLSGGTGGAWKTSEWFPTLLLSSQVLGCLPEIPGHISWVSIHDAAQSLVQMRTSKRRYLHLTHPHPAPLKDIIGTIADELRLTVVSYTQWLELLEASADQDSSGNPGLRLLEFFRAYREVAEEEEPFFSTLLSSTNAQEASSVLAHLPPLGKRDARQWVEYLRTIGYLS
ncbi:hypothetical protein C8R46DRAFT_1357140 [Mycena filopes]|nr:hypothetical protein C8R46DRAFT_1357140 [Mycena filopes]